MVIDADGDRLLLNSNVAIEVDSGVGLSTIGDVNNSNNGTTISVDDATQLITLRANNGVYLPLATIKYPITMNLTDVTLVSNSTYGQTFYISVAPFTATLPQVDGTNVGIQFLITNTNATTLVVGTSGEQLIYSSRGAASATSRSLAVGHSHIFTAIYTISNSDFGWSMV